MGLRNWVLGDSTDPLADANQLRGIALETPEDVDVARLVELFAEAEQRDVARAAAAGIETLAQQRPGKLVDYVPDLLTGTIAVEGIGAKQRDRLATAVEHVAVEYPAAIDEQAELLVESLTRELDAESVPGTDVRLYPETAAALSRAAGAAEIGTAKPVLKRLRRHRDATVSDAARDALRAL